EADEVHEILGAGMEPYELVGRELQAPGRGREVEAELGVLVAARQLDDPRWRQHRRGRLRHELGDRRAQGLVAAAAGVVGDGAWIVVDEQRRVGRNRLDDPGQPLLLNQELEGADSRIDLDADLLAELDAYGEIARRQKPQRARSPPARSSADR